MDKQIKKEGAVLLTLAVLLTSVFVCSVSLYDRIEAQTEQGTLSVFAADVRDFLTENETAMVFLGIEEKAEEAATDGTDDARIAMAAEQYISYYNGVYKSLS